MEKNTLPDRTNRQRLLKACMDRGLPQSTILRVVAPMAGKADDEKEKIAAEILPEVEAGAFDTQERTDYSLDKR